MAYPNAIISHYPITNSDHCLLLLSLFGSVDAASKSFKFEGFWLHNSSCMCSVRRMELGEWGWFWESAFQKNSCGSICFEKLEQARVFVTFSQLLKM